MPGFSKEAMDRMELTGIHHGFGLFVSAEVVVDESLQVA
jgi:hypothetical protein